MNRRSGFWETGQLRAEFVAAPSRLSGPEVVAPASDAVWAEYLPTTDKEMAADGLAHYHGGDPAKSVVYEGFLPASAAGIRRSNLDTDPQPTTEVDNCDYRLDWLAVRIDHHIHDPYELYEKVGSS